VLTNPRSEHSKSTPNCQLAEPPSSPPRFWAKFAAQQSIVSLNISNKLHAWVEFISTVNGTAPKERKPKRVNKYYEQRTLIEVSIIKFRK
jgi:hypothetical protein